MEALVAASHDFLLGDATVPPERLQDLEVQGLFDSVVDLFSLRLKAKGLRLKVASGKGLWVKGLPEVLQESVLGNLLSNAIKFSPPGSCIELEARRENGSVLLGVADLGLGLSQGLRAALDQGGELPVRAGTAGEPGQGYGLRLVQEHLARLGGSLELRPRKGGGTLALVRLKAGGAP
jgi:signal transduction histidine kinase